MAVLELLQGDITCVKVDAIVNAANSGLLGGGGVDGAIHRAAGPELLAECQKIAQRRKNHPAGACPTGEAVITGPGRLPCKKVIHTVGPVWYGGAQSEPSLLAACYRNSLLLAQEAGLESIAFPNISTGVYGYPKAAAAEIAVKTVKASLAETPGIKQVIFVCHDEENYKIYKNLADVW
ncbi:MAG: O-acetyl-ADP-ribose deacetylase [Treponema sp.]|jgi:O-acetyl-ADP-ribose deacetylase (regulator of RNase III)|nr:O-acetyl-ADP-ribose deacetylase [Treponema sp.]